MAHIKLPKSFEEQYVLFQNILQKHQEDGAASPLINNFDMDMLAGKATIANDSNTTKDEYERLAEIETERRDNEWKVVKLRMRNIGQFLKAKYSDNPHMLGLWGFTVDDYVGNNVPEEPVPPTEIIATITAPVFYEIGMSGNADKSVMIDFGGERTVVMTFDGQSTNFENFDFTETGTKQVKVSGNVIDILEYHSNNSHVTDLYLPDDARNINTLVLQNNNLSTAAVDYILIRMNGFNTVGKVINLIGNASPSALGLAAKAALEARGWIVLIS